jgi:hypothetical protein
MTIKTKALGILLYFLFHSILLIGQNDAVIFQKILLPTRFDFQSEENEYRVSSIIKNELEKKGYEVFYADGKVKVNYNDRCEYASVDVIRMSTTLRTRMYVQLKDCDGKVLFQTPDEFSKEKHRPKAHSEALLMCLNHIPNAPKERLPYKQISKQDTERTSVTEISSKTDTYWSEIQLYAQKLNDGYQLVDTTPKVLLRATPTSVSNVYLATGLVNGIITITDGKWFLEYQKEGTSAKVQLNVKD